MKTLRFEITITLSDASELSEDDVAGKVSDAIGQFADDDASIEDFDIVQLSDTDHKAPAP